MTSQITQITKVVKNCKYQSCYRNCLASFLSLLRNTFRKRKNVHSHAKYFIAPTSSKINEHCNDNSPLMNKIDRTKVSMQEIQLNFQLTLRFGSFSPLLYGGRFFSPLSPTAKTNPTPTPSNRLKPRSSSRNGRCSISMILRINQGTVNSLVLPFCLFSRSRLIRSRMRA